MPLSGPGTETAFLWRLARLVEWGRPRAGHSTTIGAVGLLLLAGLLLINQPLYPAPWFDEGLNVGTAATLARSGAYGLPDGDGVQMLAPAVQTGPPVLVPVALLFRLWQPDLRLARLVVVAYALACAWIYWILARRLIGQWPAALAVALLIIGTREPGASFVYSARQTLGEVPALCLLLGGTVVWLRTFDASGNTWRAWSVAGVLWGLAMITKTQPALLWLVSLPALFVADRLFYHRTRLLTFVVPVACAALTIGAWYAVQVALVGLDTMRANSAALAEGFHVHILALNPTHWDNARDVIWRTGWLFWGLPGIVWGAMRASRRDGVEHGWLLALTVAGMLWFAVFSIGWGRYAFYPMVLSPIWTAGMLSEVLASQRLGRIRHWAAGAAAAAVVMYALLSGSAVLSGIVRPVDTGFLAMRQHLRQSVPADSRILSWEWEFSMDAVQPIHHPSMRVANEFTEHLWSGAPRPVVTLPDLDRACTILVGPFAAWTGIYRDALAGMEPLKTHGQYTLFGDPDCRKTPDASTARTAIAGQSQSHPREPALAVSAR